MRCGNTPWPCASDRTTQHSDIYRTTGLLYPFSAGIARREMEDRFCVRVDFFKAVLGIQKLDTAFYVSGGLPGRGMRPAPEQSVGKHNR